jgi:hypothetical protein
MTPTDVELATGAELAKRLTQDLKDGKTEGQAEIAEEFKKLSLEAVLISFKNHVGVDMMVKYNLDENPHFANLIQEVSNYHNQKTNELSEKKNDA